MHVMQANVLIFTTKREETDANQKIEEFIF
jgi:hypothetical protein